MKLERLRPAPFGRGQARTRVQRGRSPERAEQTICLGQETVLTETSVSVGVLIGETGQTGRTPAVTGDLSTALPGPAADLGEKISSKIAAPLTRKTRSAPTELRAQLVDGEVPRFPIAS